MNGSRRQARHPADAARADRSTPRGGAAAQPQTGFGRLLWPLVIAVSLGGAGLVAYGGWIATGLDWPVLLLLATLAALAERFDFSLYGDSRVSLAFVPIFAAIVLFGLPGLVVVVPPAVVASALGSQRPLYKTGFNFGALMLAGGASVLAFNAFGSAGHPDSWPWVLGPTLLAAAVNFAVNSGLVAVAIGLSSGTTLKAVWREHFHWLWPHYLVLGVLGLAIATAYSALGFWGIAVFLAPPLMMRLSIKQYLDRTAKGVFELREAHQELQTAHAQVTEAMGSLSKAYDGTLHSLVAALDARDSETGGHSERVAEISIALAREMGVDPDCDEWRHIRWGALLHDVGKIAVPDEVLRKPGKLSDSEWVAMHAHPLVGYQILQSVEFLAPAAEVVRAHHEHFDGSGYPHGLAGDEIPLGARIFAVADAFDAMTSERPYRPAVPPEEALAELLRHSGTQFDPVVVRAFLSVFRDRFHTARRSVSPIQHLSETVRQAILEAAGLESDS